MYGKGASYTTTQSKSVKGFSVAYQDNLIKANNTCLFSTIKGVIQGTLINEAHRIYFILCPVCFFDVYKISHEYHMMPL